mmetsp:Transcript_70250/g.121718  ORF Transcript_70250/g.121718 Transcript_70250/m.121718 type:complete len:211 (+) Transcript_70250:232-864(+)
MKPDWDRLSDDFAGSKSAGVFDVDCTGEGSSLCEEVGVSGYPTIKFGDPSDKKGLQVYEGERDYNALKSFADDHLGPVCRPGDLDACGPKDREILEGFLKLTPEQLLADYKKAAKDQKDKDKKIIKRRNKYQDKKEQLKEDEKDYLNVKVKKGKEEEHKKKGQKLKDRKKKLEEEEVKMQEETKKFEENAKTLKLMKMATDAHKPAKADL